MQSLMGLSVEPGDLFWRFRCRIGCAGVAIVAVGVVVVVAVAIYVAVTNNVAVVVVVAASDGRGGSWEAVGGWQYGLR